MRQPTIVVSTALLAAVLLLSGCGGDDEAADPASTAPTSTAPTTTAVERACPSAADGQPASAGPFAVGRLVTEYVDPSRPTEPAETTGRPTEPQRSLPVDVLYPAEGEPDAAVTDDAVPASGQFPVVVYSHGVSSSGAERHDALGRWVRAGYIVVAPTFPLSSVGISDISDLPNQPGDVEFVAESFRSDVQRPDHPLHRSALIDCLALAGHSLGGATTLAAAFDPCCDSLEPDAVIDIAGVALNLTPDTSFGDAAPRPVLIVHGALDAVVPVAQSERAFAELAGPRWFVTFPGGAHSSMFLPPEVEVLTDAVVAFLDAQLKGAPDSLEELPDAVAASGIATLQVAPGT